MHALSDTQLLKSQRELADLKEQYVQLQERFTCLSAEVKSSMMPKQVIELHIKRLKEYNELRDAGLKLAQLVADEKACRIKEVFEEMGYSMKDD